MTEETCERCGRTPCPCRIGFKTKLIGPLPLRAFTPAVECRDAAGNAYAEGPYDGPFVSARCGECGGYGNHRYTAGGDSIGCSPCGGLGRVKIVSEADSLAGADAVDRPAPARSSGAGGSNT